MTSGPGYVMDRLPDGTLRFSLTDPEISWLRIDYQARIRFGEAELVIETPFVLTVRGQSRQLDLPDRESR